MLYALDGAAEPRGDWTFDLNQTRTRPELLAQVHQDDSSAKAGFLIAKSASANTCADKSDADEKKPGCEAGLFALRLRREELASMPEAPSDIDYAVDVGRHETMFRANTPREEEFLGGADLTMSNEEAFPEDGPEPLWPDVR